MDGSPIKLTKARRAQSLFFGRKILICNHRQIKGN